MGALFTIKQLMTLTDSSRREIEDAVKNGRLPKPIPFGPWSVGWEEEAIKSWLATQEENNPL